MKKRTGLIGLAAAAGAAVAAGGAGVAAVSVRRRSRRRGIDVLAEQQPERSGRVGAEDGVGLYYEEDGPSDAPLTVVFSHGYCLRLGEFCFQREALTQHFGDQLRMVFYDQRSHGRSDRSPVENVSIDQLGRDLGSIIDAVAPAGPLVLIGHSMGGMTVMALADSRPELFDPLTGRVHGVGLISTSAGKMATVALGLPAAAARFTTPALSLLLRGARHQANLVERGRAVGSDIAWYVTRKISFGSPDIDPSVLEYLTAMIASTRIDVIADFYPTLMSHDKLAALKNLSGVPVRIIAGSRDVLAPIAHSREIAAALPDAELVVVPKAGHMALMEFPEVVDNALIELIERALHGSS